MKTLKPQKKQARSSNKPNHLKKTSRLSRWYQTLPEWLRKILRSWPFRIIASILVLWYVVFNAGWLLNFIPFPPVSNPNYGVSFSAERSRELGLDPHANFTALLDDMGIRNYRLMSYWDEIEPTRGHFDFSELDWEMDMVAKYGGHVTLAIGLRQPRWPECHAPNWSYDLKGNSWKQALYAFMQIIAKRYENHPALLSWQLENEAMNVWFGPCGESDLTRIKEEFALLKSWTKKPVWMSLSDQHGYPVNTPVPDKYGYSVYRTVWNNLIPPTDNYIVYPTPIWYHRLRAAIIKSYTGKDIFIHELQLEPWGPTDTKNLSIAEQDKSMSVKQIHDSIYFAREIGAKDIYVWGGEWWYWRKVNGDPSIWNQVKHELQTQR